MRVYAYQHLETRKAVADSLSNQMAQKYETVDSLAEKSYLEMGLSSASSARCTISGFRSGKAISFQSRKRPNRNQGLSFNEKELDRLSILFDLLETPVSEPIIVRLQSEYPSDLWPQFVYPPKPKEYFDSLDSARL